MNCAELVAYLSQYIDYELNEDLAQDAQEHLAQCHNCQVVLNTTQKMIVLGRDQTSKAIPVERREALFERLQHAFLQSPKAVN